MEQWEDRADGVVQCVEQCAGSAQGVPEFVFEDDAGGLVSGGTMSGRRVVRLSRNRWGAFFMIDTVHVGSRVAVHLGCGDVAVGVLVHFNDLLRELLDKLGVELLEVLVNLSEWDFGCVVFDHDVPQRVIFRGCRPDQHSYAWWESFDGTALRVIHSGKNAAQGLRGIVAQLGGGESVRKQPQLHEGEGDGVQVGCASTLRIGVGGEGERASVDPGMVGAEGVGVDLRQFYDCRSLTGGVAACRLEERGVLGQQSLGDGEGGGGLRVVFVDDDGELFAEVGDTGQRSVQLANCQEMQLVYPQQKAISVCERGVGWRG